MIAEEPSKIEETVDSIKDYLNTRYELATLKAADKASHMVSNTASFIPIMFITVLTVLMVSVGLGLYLDQLMESEFLGFFVLAGCYLIIGLILLAIRKNSIARPLRNKIIKELFRTHNVNIKA
jgi:F0F1-type ATP synthase assembly protein I